MLRLRSAGTSSYILFTLHKLVGQLVKQLQAMLDAEGPECEHLLQLFTYERL